MKAMRALSLALVAFLALAAQAAQAATPAPALKLLAVTGPTNLPPQQSETQRLAVEAEGGTFTLTATKAKGQGTLDVATGFGQITEGSNQAVISVPLGGTFKVGQLLSGSGIPANTTIIGVSGSTLELSSNATETNGFAALTGASKAMSGVSASYGAFSVGDDISGGGIPAGTTVAAVGAGTLTLSQYPTQGGTVALTATATTASLAFNASAETLEGALQAILGTGSLSVTGGPGGDAGHPYFIAFGGSLANEDVVQLTANLGMLTGEHAFAHIFTTVPGGRGTGDVFLLPANAGALGTSGTITAHLGPLPAGVVTSAAAHGLGWSCGGGAGESEVTCTTTEPMAALDSYPRPLIVPVEVLAGAPASATVPSELSGGGSSPATFQLPLVVSAKPAPPGVAAAWGGSFEADGSPSAQAGGHPFQGSAYFMVNTLRTKSGQINPVGDSREVVVDLPPGFVGNPLASKRCPQSTPLPQAGASLVCNDEMTVGSLNPWITALSSPLPLPSPLYNGVPAQGYAAEFTTRLAFPLQSVLATIKSEEDFGIRLTAPNNANYLNIYGAFSIFEGVPANGIGQALLTNPVNCEESAETAPVLSGKNDTYQERGNYSPPFVVEQPALTGCDQLEFKAYDPSTEEGQVAFSFRPTSTTGSSPVGATAHLHIDQGGLTEAGGLATPQLKRSVIELPAGLELNPSSANGLEACSEAQIGFKGSGFPMPNPLRFTEAQPTCPDASKLGSAEINTPILENPLVGEVFLAKQEENPFGSLIAIYLVVNDPLTGVLIKLPGKVKLDPGTGRMTAIFDNSPQLPYEDLTLKFRGGGPRSLFSTSEVCGASGAEGEWTPWSAPESGPPAQTTDSFEVSGNCSASAGARPFHPGFEAGTTDPAAGSYSPMVVKVSRADGEQEISQLSFTLPEGLTGKLAGIPSCSEAQIQAAEAKTGRQERQSPSCPPASKLGTIDTAAGVGSGSLHVGGELYLGGPYKGAPVSAVAITPALAGPYDLGDVVIRTPLHLNPETAQLTASSDPIPTILKGIPLKIRDVAISVDRSSFILNPTSCDASSMSASIAGSSGATASVSSRFQVGGCESLGFAPAFEGRLKGGTKRGDHPAFTATLTYPQGAYANLASIAVTLPHAEFLENAHIGTVCTRVQFAAEQCPAGSVYGQVEAETPLLDEPLTGNVYLRSSDNKLPNLVLALKGPPSQPIKIDLDGRIDSIKGGIRTTFEAVPDAPVSRVVLRMKGGKKGLLVNSRNLCTAGGGRMTVRMVAHNNRLANRNPLLKNQCAKARKGKAKRKRSR